MKREIRADCPVLVEPVSSSSLSEVKDWLESQGTILKLRWLLAHADDGVIWGEQRNGRLVICDSLAASVAPELRRQTLQQARLFSPETELLLWRDGDQFRARLMRPPVGGETSTFTEAIDEPQILWGTKAQALGNNF